MTSSTVKTPLSKDEQITAVTVGKKLAYFVAALPVSAHEKQEIATFIQEMSIEQMVRLAKIVDYFYAESKTAKLEEFLKDNLLKIKKELDEKGQKSEEEFLKKLEELEKNLEK
jgi:replicative DNA helicase